MVIFHDVDEESPWTWGCTLNGNGHYSQQIHPKFLPIQSQKPCCKLNVLENP